MNCLKSLLRARFLVTVCLVLLLAAPLITAQQSVELARADLRRIVEVLANDIQRHFYDPSMKGLDIKRLAQETKQRINGMSDVGEMHAAIWEFVNQVDDSHTRYSPPRLTVTPSYGFRARPIGTDVAVVSVTKNGPAARGGLHAGDKLLALNGRRVTRENINDTLFFFSKLRPVRLLVVDYVRDGAQDRLTIEPDLRRDPAIRRIDDISDYYRDVVEWENYAMEVPFLYGSVDDVRYVKLTSFSGGLPETVMWKIKDATAVIVDLRGNPGGNTEVLKQMTGFFDRENTPIVDMVGRKKTEKLISKPQRVHFDCPLVILVDGGSGSASEIFAYHMQRLGRATIIGDHTSGAVSAADVLEEHVGAQPVIDFRLMVTTSKLVFPDGNSIEKIGVTPDVLCVPKLSDIAADKDPCLAQAAAIAKEKLATAQSGRTAGK